MRIAPSSSLRSALRGPSLLLVGAVALAACGSTSGGARTAAPTTASGVTTAPATIAPTTAPEIKAGPTPLALMAIGLLPGANVPADVKVSCEDPAGATLSCEDAIALAARLAIVTSGASPIQQVLVERGAHADAVTVTFWAVDAESGEVKAFTTTVDVAAGTITFPVENADAVFPS